MHDLATIQRMNREATQRANEDARRERLEQEAARQRHPAGKGRITEPALDAARATHDKCGSSVTFDREHISDGDPDVAAEHGTVYVAACLECDEDLFEHEITRQAGPRQTATRVPLSREDVDSLISPSARELAEEMLVSFTRNGEIPFALSGERAVQIMALAIEADRARREQEAGE